MKTIWLSFVDREAEKGFLGVTIVDVSPEDEADALARWPDMHDKVKGPTILAATLIAKAHDANPGGEVQGLQVDGLIPKEWKNRLMDKVELLAKGLIGIDPKEALH